MLEKVAKVDEKDGSGYTALMTASQNGCEGIVNILLQVGAKVDEANTEIRH